MKTYPKPTLLLTLFTLLLAALACSTATSTPSAPQATGIPQATNPPLPPTDTPAPTATPLPTAMPTPRGPLTLNTLSQMESLIRFGRGSIQDLSLKSDGSVLAVASAVGVWFYDPETLAIQHALDNPTRNITNIAWSPDGNLLAFSDDTGMVMIWDDASQTVIQTLTAASSQVSALSWAPDSQQLATISGDGKVQIWDVASWEVTNSLEGYFDYGQGVAWSPDGTSLAFTGYIEQNYKSTIRLWQPASNEITELYTVDGITGPLQWSPDGQHLALAWYEPCMGGSCDSILLFEIADGKTASPKYFSSASFSWAPDGSQLALEHYGGKIDIFDLPQNKIIQTLEESNSESDGSMKQLLWTSDGRHLITVSNTDEISVWDTTTLEVVLKMREHAPVGGGVWVPDRTVLAYKVRNDVHLWNPSTNETLLVLNHDRAVNSFSFAPDGGQLITGSGKFPQIFEIFEVASGEISNSWEESDYGFVKNVTWSPDGQLIAASGSYFGFEYVVGGGVIRDATNGELIYGAQMNSFGISHTWAPDGRTLALIEYDQIHLWDATQHKERLILHATDWIGATAWSPDGTKLAAGDDGGILTVWDAKTLEILYQFENGSGTGLENIAWSPDGTILASGGYDEQIQLWDMSQGVLLTSLTGHGSVSTLAWFADGSFLASGDIDGNIYFWSIPGGALLHTLKAHATSISNLLFSPDGSLLTSASSDGTIQIWGVGALQTP